MSGRSTVKRAPASVSSSPNGSSFSLHLFSRSNQSPADERLEASICPNRPFSSHANSALGRVITGRRSSQQSQSALLDFRRQIAINLNERTARSRRSLRAPDQALESKDERVHLWRT